MPAVNRRKFIQSSAATVAALTQARPLTLLAAEQPAALTVAGNSVAGKDARLIVHVAEPPVLETPPALLAGQQITPTSLFFVRNCQPTPEVKGVDPLAAWQVEIAGLVNRPQSFTGKVLRALPKRQVEMVVQCSGNGRAIFSEAAKTEGSRWLRGGMANVRFAGARLSDLLNHLGIKPDAKAKYLAAEGRDNPKPGKADFEHSLPLDEVLEKSLLVWELNGESLPAVHGGPLRLVTPGFYGTMHVKWVGKLRFEDHETTNDYQVTSYRTPREVLKPGTALETNLDNSKPHWRMRLKSVVLSPAPGERVPAGKVQIAGVAFNDGEARIDSVLISTDRGQSWQQARLETPDSPYAWYQWQAALELSTGNHEVWARAVDALGRTQPSDGNIFWNPKGYTWNGVEKIKLTAT